MEKPLLWIGSALTDLRTFPEEARRRAGFELFQVQLGHSPSDWKPMATIGPGVIESRIHTESEHRIIYVAKFKEAIYVLHAFEKKTQKTTKHDIDLARTRFAAVIAYRRKSQRERT
jgi:phage-related protein